MVIFLRQDVFVCLHDHVHCDTLAEEDQCTGIERGFLLVAGETYEVLQVWILRDLFHKFTVRILKLCLDDERTKSHP